MSNRPAKPPHAARLTPYLSVRDPEASIKFYEKAFGFKAAPQTTMRGPDGKIMHAEMRFHEAVIMFAPEGAWGGKCRSPATSGTAAPISLYLYCDDVDAFFKKATAAGATTVSPLQDMFWGDRMCALADPDGYQWSFATNVGDFDPSKMQAMQACSAGGQ